MAYVAIPTGSDTALGLLKVGNGIDCSKGQISLTISEDSGIDIGTSPNISGTFSIKNTGIRGITVDGKKYENCDTVTISSDSSGAVNFTDGTTAKFFVINGWDSKQNASTAIRTTKADGTSSTSTTGKIGSTLKPVFINDDNVPKEITSLSLSNTTSTVASFTGSTSSGNAVEITGLGVTSGSATSAALKVTGGIVASSGISASAVYHAVWNDVSDAIEVQDDCVVEPGYCYYFNGTEYHKTDKYCQKGIIGIHSDTAGSILGKKGKHKELDISIGGFVLAYVDDVYEQGTPLTATKDGKLTKMKLIDKILHPERLVATYWKPEMEEYWGDENRQVKVDGRTWVKVK